MKSYYADTVQLAVEQARRELGVDAALVTSRVSSADARHLGQYEVVFATDLPLEQQSAPAAASLATAPPQAPTVRAGSIEELSAQLGMVRRQVEMWRQASIETMEQPRWMLGEPELQRAFAHLLGAEVDRDLATQLLASARRNATAQGSDLRTAIEDEICRCVRVDPDAGSRIKTQTAVALVGPPGAGKTTTLAKLAIRYGIAARRPLTLISYDAQRLGAAEQLRWYASILGVAFQSVDTNLALSQAIEERRGKGLVLIDTPGFTVRDLAAGCEQAQYLSRREDVETHLVLPLSMRSGDLARAAEAFDVFRPARLIFTRLDETETYGPMLTESERCGLPVSFFGTGQNVPEDLEPANKEILVERLMPPVAERARKVLSAA